MKAFWLLIVLSAYSASSWSITYQALLPNVIAKLPQMQTLQDYQGLSDANRLAADSWIPGEVELNLKHENDALTGDQGFQSWEGGASFPVWWPEQSKHQNAIGRGYQHQSQTVQARLALMASEKLRQLVWSTTQTTVKLQFAREDLQQTQALVALIQQGVVAGDRPQFDLLLAQKSLNQAQKRLAQLTAEHRMALQQYQAWTDTTELPDPIAEVVAQPAPTLESHPDIEWLQAQQQTEMARLALAKASRLSQPNVYLAVKNERDDQTSDNNILIAEVRLPIGENPMAATQIAAQRQQLSQAQIAITEALQQLRKRQFEARETLKAAEIGQTLAAEQRKLAQQAMQLAQSAYRQGETSIQNLLQMKQQYFDDQLNDEMAKLERLEAIANLNQALGVRLP
ncbi:MAG: TolC family protein [Hydrogenovibrio sp.]